MEKIISYNKSYPIKDIFHTYVRKVNSIKSLELQEEILLTRDYFDNKNIFSAKKIIESHLKLVVKIAIKYRNFGQNIIDMIQEGNIGLMKAVEKFNPYAGFRFSTYAAFWIKSNIKEYILKTWSLVRIGTTSLQKKLFYSLNKLKARIVSIEGRSFQDSDYETLAKELGSTKADIMEIDSRLSERDVSLNRSFVKSNKSVEAIDLIQSNTPDPSSKIIMTNDAKLKQNLINDALSTLKDRERQILIARKLDSEQKTLDELSKEFGISKERIRQIEVAAMEKIKNFVTSNIPNDLRIHL